MCEKEHIVEQQLCKVVKCRATVLVSLCCVFAFFALTTTVVVCSVSCFYVMWHEVRYRYV